MIHFDCRLKQADFALDATFDTDGGLTALFGPSGSGKSTIIRLFAGLERPDSGTLRVNGDTLVDTARHIWVPPHRRRIGLVFQDAQLFPHLSVAGNLHYGRWFTAQGDRRIDAAQVIDVLGIGHLLQRNTATLSGGERQRVAIGRALLASPRLLLMDEPLASLDAPRKLEILPFIEHLRDAFAIPIIYVSHAVEEVARLATRVVKIDNGRVTRLGSPAEVLAPMSLQATPDRFEAVSILTGKIDRYLPDYGITLVAHPAGEIAIPGQLDPSTDIARIAIRATNVTLAVGRPANVSVRTALHGQIAAIETDGGPFALATIALPGGDLLKCYATRLAIDNLGLGVGDDVQALVKAVAIDERGIPGLHVVTAHGRA